MSKKLAVHSTVQRLGTFATAHQPADSLPGRYKSPCCLYRNLDSAQSLEFLWSSLAYQDLRTPANLHAQSISESQCRIKVIVASIYGYTMKITRLMCMHLALFCLNVSSTLARQRKPFEGVTGISLCSLSCSCWYSCYRVHAAACPQNMNCARKPPALESMCM